MPQASPTAALFQRADAKVIDTFADRRGDGELDTDSLRIEMPNKGQVYTAPCVRQMEETTEGPDANGNWVKETRIIVGAPRSYFAGLDSIPVKAACYLGGVKFAVADSGSKLDETWLTLAMVRPQMTENNPARRV